MVWATITLKLDETYRDISIPELTEYRQRGYSAVSDRVTIAITHFNHDNPRIVGGGMLDLAFNDPLLILRHRSLTLSIWTPLVVCNRWAKEVQWHR